MGRDASGLCSVKTGEIFMTSFNYFFVSLFLCVNACMYFIYIVSSPGEK